MEQPIKKEYKKEYKKDQRFEFTLYLNDNIIVQRYFNVIGFNIKAVHSLNFKDAVDIDMKIIQRHLVDKTLDYMTENSRLYYDDPTYDQSDQQDVMKMVIKLDNKNIAFRQWDATVYPVKVRYTVDVRERIYDIITRIQKCLSERTERLETTYLDYNLLPERI